MYHADYLESRFLNALPCIGLDASLVLTPDKFNYCRLKNEGKFEAGSSAWPCKCNDGHCDIGCMLQTDLTRLMVVAEV